MGGSTEAAAAFSLASVRASLVRQEDTIVFSLIERANYPRNSRAYHAAAVDSHGDSSSSSSLLESFVRETEAVHAKAGRYQNQEEVPFFPDELPASPVTCNHPEVLFPAAAAVNINKSIWDMYLNKLLPLFTSEGDDGNYASTLACDLVCLQALSRRIHYGRFVAEVKFKDAPQDYGVAIRDQDKNRLMEMLTFPSVEEAVKARVKKKGSIFGQNISLDDKDGKTTEEDDKSKFKVNPSVFSLLYGEWIIPLTKLVEVEYLLHRLE